MATPLDSLAEPAFHNLADADDKLDLDHRRLENTAYEYLCHLEEARIWIQACINEELPSTTDLEENLRNGVYLAKLGHFVNPNVVSLKKIYDIDQRIYESKGLEFRHTDNINHWFRAMESVGFSSHFFPNTFDVYDKKNMPKVIYCIHALSMYLFKIGKASKIQDLYGKVEFSSEEVNAMSKELQKYGIKMPAFRKINGIFTDDISEDDVLLHAAVIAVNAAIDKQTALMTVQALQNSNVHVENVLTDLSAKYQEALYIAKKLKAEAFQNRSLELSITKDVYDELLTQQEIQTVINETNALVWVEAALLDDDITQFKISLSRPQLDLHDIKGENMKLYMDYIKTHKDSLEANNNLVVIGLTKSDIQNAIDEVNKTAISLALEKVNAVLSIGTALDTLEALKNPALNLSPVYDFAAYLYHAEFVSVRNETCKDLQMEELQGGLQLLSSIALINQAIENEDVEEFYKCLCAPTAHLTGIRASNKKTYFKGLRKELANKKHEKRSNSLLTHSDIQEIIDVVNQVMEALHNKSEVTTKINESIRYKDLESLMKGLLDPVASIICVDPKHALLYLDYLYFKQSMNKNSTDLSLEDIQKVVSDANRNALQVYEICVAIASVNIAIEDNDSGMLISALCKKQLGLIDIDECLGKAYLTSFRLILDEKKKSLEDDQYINWIHHEIKDELYFYFNLKTLEWKWEKSNSNFPVQSYLSLQEMKKIVKDVNEKEALWQNKDLSNKNHVNAIVSFQSHARRWLAQKRYQELKLKYQSAKKIQTWWRFYHSRRSYEIFEQAEINPSILLVRKLILTFHSIDKDYAEELELQKLKAQVVQTVRYNQELEQEVKEMDIKIGLLVRNRITLQELISHKQKGKNPSMPSSESWIYAGSGLKALNKDSQNMLEAYEHLFHALQTEPTYLARLIFAMPPSRSSKFIESVIFALYNYGSTNWEEYQLIRLFRTALEQEIEEKITDVDGISTGNPLVIKMVVTFNRNCALRCLRELLEPVVQQVIDDQNLKIVINPVDVYKLWINEIETNSGEPSGYSYHVTQEEALQHEEVRRRLNLSIQNLKSQVEIFCNRIVTSLELIPYGMLYIAKVLKNALSTKFPTIQQKDILKVVGNLLYYRYINPVIVAPDAFDIVTLNSKDPLTNEQRRNLGCIAKVLQFAASGKGFSSENVYLESLNPFINKCYEKFRDFFAQACCVPEPEEYFAIDSYTEATLLVQPAIYLTIQELCDTHRLLHTHQRDIAPNPNEPICQLLDDLGSPPTLEKLVGHNVDSSSLRQISQSTICLTLSSKFTVVNTTLNDVDDLFLKTKEMFVELIKVRNREVQESAQEILNAPVRPEEDRRFLNGKWNCQEHRNRKKFTSLSSFIDELNQNLHLLEISKKVSKENGYCAILSSIIKDLRYLSNRREVRKSELIRMPIAQRQLNMKTTFFKEKLEFYQQYVKRCLDNLSLSTAKGKNKGDDKKKMKKHTIKYTASKLQEKGILVQIRDVEPSQMKHITFELAPTLEVGIFTVSAKFLGMDVEKVVIDIQELLHLQYNGIAIMKLFDQRATVNINLLLYLLNSKFYK